MRSLPSAALLLALLTACAGHPVKSEDHPLLGQRLLIDEAQAPITFLLLWAPWCGTCKPWLAELERLSHQAGAEARVLGVAVSGSSEEVARVVSAYGLHFEQRLDPALLERLGFSDLPRVLVLDQRQRLTHVLPLSLTSGAFEPIFWRLIALRPLAPAEAVRGISELHPKDTHQAW